MEVKKCVFCHQDETIKHLFFQCHFARSIWSVIQVASTLFPPCSITNIFRNWLNGIDNRFKKHIRVGVIAVIWSLWLCRNDKVFNDKNIPSCRLSTGPLVHSVCGHLYSVWRIATFIQRSVHDWKLRRGILFPNMDGRIAYGLVLLVRRDYNCSL
jgi:hypothetical protein